MAIQSDPTIAGFNCFVSASEADDYFAGMYFGDSQSWDDVSANQEALLITATRALNSLPWIGTPADPTQALAFPRSFGISGEYGYSTGTPTTIPQWLKEATCEMAFWIWSADDRPATDIEFAQLKSQKIGPVDYTFRDATAFSNLPPAVLAILRAQGADVISLNTKARSMGIVL